eukprot:214031-Pleurochrysis_carterae.AAC.2
MHLLTHARTHARAHARAHARTHERTNERKHTCTHARTHAPLAERAGNGASDDAPPALNLARPLHSQDFMGSRRHGTLGTHAPPIRYYGTFEPLGRTRLARERLLKVAVRLCIQQRFAVYSYVGPPTY